MTIQIDPMTTDELKKISHSCLDLIASIRQAKSKEDLLEAGKILSGINYSLLYILKQAEKQVIDMEND